MYYFSTLFGKEHAEFFAKWSWEMLHLIGFYYKKIKDSR